MNDLKTPETVPAWPADGRPSWAPKLRWVVLAFVLLIVAFLLIANFTTLYDVEVNCGFCND